MEKIITYEGPKSSLIGYMFDKILIATDGSKYSQKAAEKGIEMAKLTNSQIIVLYVADEGRYYSLGDMGFSRADDVIKGIRNSILQEGDAAVKSIEAMAKAAWIPVQSRVVEGNPANQILKVAEEAQAKLIVMGRIGRTGLERYLLGSVAEKVVRNSRTPVMVVHG